MDTYHGYIPLICEWKFRLVLLFGCRKFCCYEQLGLKTSNIFKFFKYWEMGLLYHVAILHLVSWGNSVLIFIAIIKWYHHLATLNTVRWYLPEAMIWIYLILVIVIIFSCLLAIYISPLEKWLYKSITSFVTGLCDFL